jgi:hypothetical protein
MLAAAEVAVERVDQLFVIKHILATSKSYLDKLKDKNNRNMAELYHAMIWEVYQTLANRVKGSHFETKEAQAYLLWGQALLKLARTYFVPDANLGKDEYLKCLTLSMEKFNQSAKILERTGLAQSRVGEYVHALAGQGYCSLMKARIAPDEEMRKVLLNNSRNVLKIGYNKMHKNPNIAYNLACISALLDEPEHCKMWLDTAMEFGTLPESTYIAEDPDLAKYSSHTWFMNLLYRGPFKHYSISQRNPFMLDRESLYRVREFSDMNCSYSPSYKRLKGAIESAQAAPKEVAKPVVVEEKPKPEPPKPQEQPKPVAKPVEVPKPQEQPKPQNNDWMTMSIVNDLVQFDEELNKLQASLIREGHSVSTVKQMLMEVWRGKTATQADKERINTQRVRLNQRLKLAGLAEKREIPGDGNCQMYSVSDQLFDNINYGKYVREKAIDWLRKNKSWKLPNGAEMGDFVHDKSWDAYCDEMARDGIWGDHLTLVAIAEVFGARIRIVSSVEGDNYMTEIDPTVIKTQKMILISHYAEFHYGSLKVANQ